MRHPVVRAHHSRVTSYFSSWQLQPAGASKLLSRHRDQVLNLGKLAGTWTRRKPHLGFLAGRRDTGLQRRWTKRLDRAPLFFPPPQRHTSSEGHPGDIVGCDTPFPGRERQTASQERVDRSIGTWQRALLESDWELPTHVKHEHSARRIRFAQRGVKTRWGKPQGLVVCLENSRKIGSRWIPTRWPLVLLLLSWMLIGDKLSFVTFA